MPRVSVIIPTYKHCDFVLATLACVFAQTFTDYEVIVVNDGSPDDTADVLRPLADAGRIRYIEQANQGQAAARNRGLAEAQGEFVAFLDDDDLWPPDKLEWQVAVLWASPDAVLVYGPAQSSGYHPEFLYPDKSAPAGLVHAAFLQRNWIISPGQTLICKSVLQQIGGFDQSLWGVDDWDLYIRLASVGRFTYSTRVALQYRFHASNASKDAWRMYVQSCRLQRKHLGIPTPATAQLWLNCRRFIADSFYPQAINMACVAMENEDWDSARRMWVKALRMKPHTLRHKRVLIPLLRSLRLR